MRTGGRLTYAVRRRIPKDYPVQPLPPGNIYAHVLNSRDVATCGTCGLSWDDATPTSLTPTPAGRCPFEAFHSPMPRAKKPKELKIEGITVADLPDLTGNHPPGGDPFLLCDRCFSRWSANAGYYFQLKEDHIFRCMGPCKGNPLRLVTAETRFVDWRKPKGSK